MSQKLVCIAVVEKIDDIPNADRIQVASLKNIGWKVVVRKNEFKVGDFCCYIQIDTILPFASWSDFLRDKKDPTKPIRLRTVKMKGQISQGLLIPISILPTSEYTEGMDVTEIAGVKKYEKPVPLSMAGQVAGVFPSILHKTDEVNVQNVPNVLNEMKGLETYWTVKCDGTSATFANIEGTIHVCSRNLSLKEGDNIYWKMYHKYDISKALTDCPDYAIQGEICGPSIQKNKLALTEHKLFVFDVYNFRSGKYLNYHDREDFCREYGLETVPLLKLCTFDFTMEQLLEMAKGTYDSGQRREGIVIRPAIETYSPTIEAYEGRSRMSFKVLNNDYLEKDEE